jgi:hypothetical protein
MSTGRNRPPPNKSMKLVACRVVAAQVEFQWKIEATLKQN